MLPGVGIILGSHLAEAHPRPAATTNFSIDNQAAIQSMQNNSRQPAQYLIDEIHRCTEALQRMKTVHQQQQEGIREEHNPNGETTSSISFTWVAGHAGSTGNKRADTLAKEAAEHGSSPIEDLPTFLHQRLPASVSAIKQAITANIKRQVKEWWRRSPRSIKMRHIDPSLPSDNYIKITNKLNRRQTSLLTQLRTGHAPLNKYLHKIRKSHRPHCPQATCTSVTEDIRHLIFTCPAYTHARYQLKRKLGRRPSRCPTSSPMKASSHTPSPTSMQPEDSSTSTETSHQTRRDKIDRIAMCSAFRQL